MFKKFTDGFSSTLAQAGEQAKARATITSTSSPRSSTSKDRPLPVVSANQVPYEEGNLHSDEEGEEESRTTSTPPIGDGDGSAQDNTVTSSSTTSELSPELQKKLSKLKKFEKKYPELLKAYRSLQAYELQVKAFEKVLGEITPATSVLDVEAFQQWANNYSLKIDMSTEELRRVGNELEALKTTSSSTQREHDKSEAHLKQKIAELELEVQRGAGISSDKSPEDVSPTQLELDALQATKLELQHSQKELQRKVESLEKSNARIQQENKSHLDEYKMTQDSLRSEMIQLKVTHAQELRKAANSGASTPLPGSISSPVPTTEETHTNGALSKSQKKKQNKKKAAKKASEDIENPQKESEMLDNTIIPHAVVDEADSMVINLTTERDALQLQLDTLRVTMETLEAESLISEQKIRKLMQHQESVEELREMLKDIGNELVEAKDQVKELEMNKLSSRQEQIKLENFIPTLKDEIVGLKSEVAALKATSVQAESLGALKEAADLKIALEAAQKDLKNVTKDWEISEKTSADRFKELTSVKEGLRNQNTDFSTLRKEHQSLVEQKQKVEATLKALESRSKALERAEKDRRDELATAQSKLIAREKELKVIQVAFKEEEIRRKSEETRATSLKSEVLKLTTLRDSIIFSRNEVTGQLEAAQTELEKANTKLSSLQQLKNKLVQERDAAQEELQMGKAKFDSATSLMESQREQTSDMQHRLRDTSDKHEAMQEELAETQRQLTERARESETMRRLLSEIDNSQESRLREMRERMEAAIAERDKAEDEAAFSGKKRAREVEDLKEKLVDVERNMRNINIEKQDLQATIIDLKKAQESASKEHESQDKDFKETRQAMVDLSHSLREAESQIADFEAERQSLRLAIKESSTKIDRLQADLTTKDDVLIKLRSERAIMLDNRHDLNPFSSSMQPRTPHGRNPSFTLQSGPPTPSAGPLSPAFSLHSVNLSDRPKEKAEVDREYIKNVLFQFIEHKEKRRYLMPAISKLLLLNKQQEGTFVAAMK